MAVHECSTDIQNRHCKSCGVSVGKGKSYCLNCHRAKKKARNNLSSQKRRAQINSLKPPKPEVIICKNCGKERSLGGYVGVIPKFCSKKCQNEFWKKDTDYHDNGHLPYCTVYFRQCKHCGAPFVGRSKLVLWCCDDCKKEIHRSRGLEKYQLTKDVGLQKRIELKKLKPPCQCSVCGVLFSPLYGHRIRSFCSDECEKFKKRERLKGLKESKRQPGARHAQNARRRMRLRKAKIENFNPIEIFERDKWKCGLCGKKVNKELKFPHLKSATLDHIIPLSKYGTHSRANVQLAHFDCNSKKGTQSKGEQLLLIG